MFIGRNDAEAEIPILWPPDAKNWLIGKDPDAGKDWRREEKRTTEDEMIGWHHWLNWREFEQAPGGMWWWTGRPCVLQSMGSQSRTQLNDWTELSLLISILYLEWKIRVFSLQLLLMLPFLYWKISVNSGKIQCLPPHSSIGKESACNAGDPGSIPGSWRSSGEGIDYPLQYSRASLVA